VNEEYHCLKFYLVAQEPRFWLHPSSYSFPVAFQFFSFNLYSFSGSGAFWKINGARCKQQMLDEGQEGKNDLGRS